ncbi:chemotaxis protein CheA [Pengzhenrongella phosphoraccumulans]|uniref:chemotaxis protein CheA n=1 Tax=Pengzhenrongella phosphoraccumulans TaxID=3114394 RepID=UPI00388FE84A
MDDMDEIVREFLVESYENLDQLDQDLVALEGAPGSRELLSSIFRTIHTIKGTSGFLAFGLLEKVTHAGENLLVQLREGKRAMDLHTTDVLLRMVDTVREILASIETGGVEGEIAVDEVIQQIHDVLENRPVASPPQPAAVAAAEPVEPAVEPRLEPADPPAGALPTQRDHAADEPVAAASEPASEGPGPRTASDASIRVDVDLLDALMRQVGELVLARNQINRLADGTVDVDLVRASQRLSLIASELQEGVMKTRMQPIDHVWAKMPRIVRDLAATCGRQVRLDMVGGDTELDRTLLEAVKDPLTHLVRNAIDHGIESPADRVAAGKAAVGVLTLRAYHAGGQVIVDVVDDGKGVDVERVAAKAIERGLRTPEQIAGMSEPDLLQLLFLPGFSMAAAVTKVSGRGVGMDVVRTKIEAIGGQVDVESTIGRGTTWRLRIPLTLAIMPALTVESAGELYAIPQVSLLELVALDGQKARTAIEYIGTAPVYRLRGDLLPLVALRDVLETGHHREASTPAVIAVLQADTQRFGLIIDRVLNTEEIVVKALSARLKGIGVYAGATLLSDGRVSLILDVGAIARRSLSAEPLDLDRESSAASAVAVVTTEQVLVAGIGGGRRVAIPLDAVTRLERLRSDLVEHVGGREVVQYRGAIVPIVRLAGLLGGTAATDLDDLLVIVSTRGARSVAIVVDEIVDIVDDDAAQHSQIDGCGLIGSTVLKDRVTERLDVTQAVLTADPTFFDDDTSGDDASGTYYRAALPGLSVRSGLDSLVGV